LVSGINDTATSMTIEAGKADLFPTANVGANPVPSLNNWFKITLQDSVGNVEIAYVRTRTAGSGILSNVLRGQEGTVAQSFLAGTPVGLRLTALDAQTALVAAATSVQLAGDQEIFDTKTFKDELVAEAGVKGDLDGNLTATTPEAPTAAFGTNTTQVATTAFVQAALQALHPVGSIYINATNSANPATYFGFGTWVAFGAGRVPVGFNAADPLFDTAEEIGGSKDAIVVSHTHTATVTDPGHAHIMSGVNGSAAAGPLAATDFTSGDTRNDTNSVTTGITVSNSTEGSSGTNANLQPYITVFMWKRTA
jgi:hypothetical protein